MDVPKEERQRRFEEAWDEGLFNRSDVDFFRHSAG